MAFPRPGRLARGAAALALLTLLTATAGAAPGVRLVASGPRAVEFELETGPLEFEDGPAGAAVRARGADPQAAPGEPDLPGRVVFIGLPQEGGVKVTAEGFEPERRADVAVRPAPAFDGRPAAELDAGIGPWPARLAEVEEILNVRGVRVARVRLNPVRWDPARREVLGYRRLAVTARFEREPRKSAEPDRFDAVLEGVLLNGAEARHWKARAAAADSTNFFDRSADWCKVRTETTGVYRVRGSDLEAAGFSLATIDPATLRLYSVGEWTMNGPYPDTMVEVPVHVSDGGDGRFDAGDYLAFYAESPSTWRTDSAGNRYWETNYFTRYRPWWLTWGAGAGRRFAEVGAGGATDPRPTAFRRARLEADRLCPARSGLLWLWERYIKVEGRDTALFRRPLDLPGRDSIASIRGRLWGVKPKDDRTLYYLCRLHLNGERLDTVVVTPRDKTPPPADFSLVIPAAAATRPGPDTLTFELYGEPQTTIYLDWLEVSYRRRLDLSTQAPFIEFEFDSAGSHEFGIDGAAGDVFLLDVTDPFRPRRLTGTTASGGRRGAKLATTGPARLCAALAANLRAPVSIERSQPGGLRAAAGADYYVVCPDEFHPAARLYARYRDGNIAGLEAARAAAVRLSEIYDDYGFGVEEPGAIKQLFLARRPAYALFAGDGTYDYRNCLGGEYPPMVPAYEVGFDVDPEVYGQTAKAFDAWYADFDGEGAGPDMILGRVTARSAVELAQYLEKVRNYETQEPGPWSRRFLLVADDEYEGSPDRPDPIGFSHITGCENIYYYARGLLDPVKLYLTEYPLTGVNDKAGARTDLYERLDAGALFWAYFGHGAGFQLAHERVLNIDGVGAVGGGPRTTIAFFGSCGVGRFEDTRYEAIAEELVRKPEGGCIATTAATKATTPGSNERFAREFFSGMLASPRAALGPSFLTAWLTYTIYNLFGDPAIRPRIPAAGLPVEVAPDTLYPGGLNLAADSVPAAAGYYAIAARELDWQRSYRSDYGSTQYTLPGYVFHRALGTFENGRLAAGFRVPRLDYPDTTIVPNGSYVRLPGTGAVSILAWHGEDGYASIRADLELGPAQAGEDARPPELRLYADGTELVRGETTAVGGEFVLRGEIEDESGILLAPVPDYGLLIARGGGSQDRVSLASRFSYDLNSTTRGAFSLPFKPAQARDSLTVFASDNLRNRLVATYHISSSLDAPLRLDSVLVSPNPVAADGYFTFQLTRPAYVGVKVFTIRGRLVRRLEPVLCGFGYNQLHWDGRDDGGNRPANGVYLYKVDARSTDAGSGSYTASHRDKFVILR
ncbi:MAG: C25 family cysteine peptidase [bacterium]